MKSRLRTPTKTESKVKEVNVVHGIPGNDPCSLAELGNPSPNTDSPIVQTESSKPTGEPPSEPNKDNEEEEEEEDK